MANGMDMGKGAELGSLLEIYEKKSGVVVMRQSFCRKLCSERLS